MTPTHRPRLTPAPTSAPAPQAPGLVERALEAYIGACDFIAHLLR